VDVTDKMYSHASTGGTTNNNFNDSGLKDFTEPFYIVNIIQDGKTVVDQNIDGYGSTGHYQKVESIIGLSNGNSNQSFPLVDERWQDCIPDLSSTGSLASDEVFVYIRDTDGVDKAWMNVTFLTPAQKVPILADIVANGFYVATGGVKVYCLYTHVNTLGEEFTIEFNQAGYNPDVDSQIIVKYDIRRPLFDSRIVYKQILY
jgi:hypothetical protein